MPRRKDLGIAILIALAGSGELCHWDLIEALRPRRKFFRRIDFLSFDSLTKPHELHVGLTASTSYALARLEQQGLVTRSFKKRFLANDTEHSASFIRITEAGKEMVRARASVPKPRRQPILHMLDKLHF